MRKLASIGHGTYNPGKLLNFLCVTLSIKNDSELAAKLGVGRALVSKIRSGTHDVSSELLLKIHDVTDISIGGLREIMGDRRSTHRFSKNISYALERRAEERDPIGHLLQASNNVSKTGARRGGKP